MLLVNRVMSAAGAVIPDQDLLVGILVDAEGRIQPADQAGCHRTVSPSTEIITAVEVLTWPLPPAALAVRLREPATPCRLLESVRLSWA